VVIIVSCALVMVYISKISPRTQNMDMARQHLCSGNTDFVVAYDTVGIPYAVDLKVSAPNDLRAEKLAVSETIKNFQKSAVQQVIGGVGQESNASLMIWLDTTEFLDAATKGNFCGGSSITPDAFVQKLARTWDA